MRSFCTRWCRSRPSDGQEQLRPVQVVQHAAEVGRHVDGAARPQPSGPALHHHLAGTGVHGSVGRVRLRRRGGDGEDQDLVLVQHDGRARRRAGTGRTARCRSSTPRARMGRRGRGRRGQEDAAAERAAVRAEDLRVHGHGGHRSSLTAPASSAAGRGLSASRAAFVHATPRPAQRIWRARPRSSAHLARRGPPRGPAGRAARRGPVRVVRVQVADPQQAVAAARASAASSSPAEAAGSSGSGAAGPADEAQLVGQTRTAWARFSEGWAGSAGDVDADVAQGQLVVASGRWPRGRRPAAMRPPPRAAPASAARRARRPGVRPAARPEVPATQRAVGHRLAQGGRLRAPPSRTSQAP